MKRFAAVILLLLVLMARALCAQTVTLVWNYGDTNSISFNVGIGTNSGVYVTNFACATTNGALTLSKLFPGTNYVAVQAYQVSTNAAQVSDWSNEVTITRRPAPALKIQVILNASTNLIMWERVQPTNNFYVADSPDSPQTFYHARLIPVPMTPGVTLEIP